MKRNFSFLLKTGVMLGGLTACEPNPPSSPQSYQPPLPLTTSLEPWATPTTPNWPHREGIVALDEKALQINIMIAFLPSTLMEHGNCLGQISGLKRAQQHLGAWLRHRPPESQVGMVQFDRQGLREIRPLGRYDDAELLALLDDFSVSQAALPLKDGIELAYRRLTQQAESQGGFGEYHLVIVSDGQFFTAQDPTSLLQHIAQTSPIALHSLGLCLPDLSPLNQPNIMIFNDFVREPGNPWSPVNPEAFSLSSVN